MHLTGLSLIDGVTASPSSVTFQAVNPADGRPLPPVYHEVSAAEVARACALAGAAFPAYAGTPASTRAAFLQGIARAIEDLGDELLERCSAETGLPRNRVAGERARTCQQLRLFATLLDSDAWARPRCDPALPDRQPLPRPDIRSLLRPIGPVAVFGPANFPLAFSVAGGDTASALAAGCPVVVKAHSSHPGTSELVGRAIEQARQACGLPAGVFSLLFGGGRTVGQAIVQHPAMRAVGFTGSRSAGRELYQLCANRPAPIPFFGELSSINPVCLLPAALASRPEQIAEGLAASVTLGCGQFCTNPGLIFYVTGNPGVDSLVSALTTQLRDTGPAPMLNHATKRGYLAGLERLSHYTGVETLLAASPHSDTALASPTLFRCSAATFRSQPMLQDEVFGPVTLLVACRDLADMTAALETMEGQLTATIHQAGDDLASARALLAVLETRVGRLIFDGYPTGVEVCSAMVHSGPWPATTDSRFTSVGTDAILRWVRPVCWQNAPASALPEALARAAAR